MTVVTQAGWRELKPYVRNGIKVLLRYIIHIE